MDALTHSPTPWKRVGPEHPCCHVAGVEAADGNRVAEVAEEQDVDVIVGAPLFREAALAASSYLAAHAALVAAGVSEERPAVARRVADAWIALTKACAELPVGGPEQDRGAAALRPAEHAFVPHPWGKDCCDGKVDDDDRVRTCTRPQGEHQ